MYIISREYTLLCNSPTNFVVSDEIGEKMTHAVESSLRVRRILLWYDITVLWSTLAKRWSFQSLDLVVHTRSCMESSKYIQRAERASAESLLNPAFVL